MSFSYIERCQQYSTAHRRDRSDNSRWPSTGSTPWPRQHNTRFVASLCDASPSHTTRQRAKQYYRFTVPCVIFGPFGVSAAKILPILEFRDSIFCGVSAVSSMRRDAHGARLFAYYSSSDLVFCVAPVGVEYEEEAPFRPQVQYLYIYFPHEPCASHNRECSCRAVNVDGVV